MQIIEKYIDGVLHIKCEFTDEEKLENEKKRELAKERRKTYLEKREEVLKRKMSNYNKI